MSTTLSLITINILLWVWIRCNTIHPSIHSDLMNDFLSGSSTFLLLTYKSLQWGGSHFNRQKIQSGMVAAWAARWVYFDSNIPQRTHGAIITSLWRQNDAAASFFSRHNDVIFCVVCPLGPNMGPIWVPAGAHRTQSVPTSIPGILLTRCLLMLPCNILVWLMD